MPTWLSSCVLSCASNYVRCALLLNTFSIHPFSLPRSLSLPHSSFAQFGSVYLIVCTFLFSIRFSSKEWEHAAIIFSVYVTHKNIIQYQKCIHSSTYYISNRATATSSTVKYIRVWRSFIGPCAPLSPPAYKRFIYNIHAYIFSSQLCDGFYAIERDPKADFPSNTQAYVFSQIKLFYFYRNKL